ncbi:hypothetical protein BABINDRAFT_159878 [Babjeviella inositovora NRRL Y-12698]|uniref:Actin-like ATPase domain-containing protein n=1 Tax=Babjeviella inositovora NRRL Y-12698 TaxID=984486 RepID=A0A1E3QVC9_9ASCO|nr:uncharacterized protein BABINDRAFT_159878 [Babjeviella inositovora NRRL Y-12698]ODQ81609.1 hypothetical protein BABINDRAFT_159878 [Babjeviella inositovora NRRL Y-12698]
MQFTTLVQIFMALSPALAALVGVDFGQEFTKSALVAPGINFEILLSADSKRKEVSGLALKTIGKDEIERLYGSDAVTICTRFPNACALHLKSIMGRSLDDASAVAYAQTHFGTILKESKNNRNTIALNINKQDYLAEELLAMSLADIKARALKEIAAAHIGAQTADDFAITVPGFFTQSQRAALLDAALVAGLRVAGLVDDGVAIAVHYASSRVFTEEKEYHIIYDMGAGSTKATLVSFVQNGTATTVEVEGYGFDATLGGHLFTESVYEVLKAKFLATNHKIKTKTFLADARAQARLWQAADKAKSILSANTEAKVAVESLYDDLDFKSVITRAEFEEYNAAGMRRITSPLLHALQGSTVTLKDVKSVILAGGSTRVPFVQAHLAMLAGEDLLARNVNADEAAVMGATLRGVQLSGMYRSKNIVVIEPSLDEYDLKYTADGKATEVAVFPRGSTVGNTTTVELVGIADKPFTLDMYENGHLLALHEFKDIKKDIKAVVDGCASAADVTVFATLSLDPSRIYDLVKVEARCTKMAETETETTETTDTKTKPKVRGKATRTLLGVTKYPNVRPMGTASKFTSSDKLRELVRKDRQRVELAIVRNDLESLLYSLRSLFDEDDIVNNFAPGRLEIIASKVAGELEWLEYDSDGAKLAEFKTKLAEYQALKSEMLLFAQIKDASLAKADFVELLSEGKNKTWNLQDYVMDLLDESLEWEGKFTKLGLDFSKESAKVNVEFPFKNNEMDDAMKHYLAEFSRINGLMDGSAVGVDETAFDDMTDGEKFLLKLSLEKMLDKIDGISASLTAVSSKRNKLLQARLARAIKKQKREEAAALEAETEAEAVVEAEHADSGDKVEGTAETKADTKTEKGKTEKGKVGKDKIRKGTSGKGKAVDAEAEKTKKLLDDFLAQMEADNAEKARQATEHDEL